MPPLPCVRPTVRGWHEKKKEEMVGGKEGGETGSGKAEPVSSRMIFTCSLVGS